MSALKAAAHAYGRMNRRRKLQAALDFALAQNAHTVLCVGVKAGTGPVANIIERGFEASGLRVTMSGLSDDEPAWTRYVQADGLALPFVDEEFDIVYSNAVLEHVGDEMAQRQFLAEHERVGRHWMATTPNRLFPVEAHTHVLFRHWREGWHTDSVSRLLSRRDLQRILPRGRVVGAVGPTLSAVSD